MSNKDYLFLGLITIVAFLLTIAAWLNFGRFTKQAANEPVAIIDSNTSSFDRVELTCGSHQFSLEFPRGLKSTGEEIADKNKIDENLNTMSQSGLGALIKNVPISRSWNVWVLGTAGMNSYSVDCYETKESFGSSETINQRINNASHSLLSDKKVKVSAQKISSNSMSLDRDIDNSGKQYFINNLFTVLDDSLVVITFLAEDNSSDELANKFLNSFTLVE